MAFFGKLIKRSLTVGEQLQKRRRAAPIQLQQRTLRRLLKQAQHTAFGQYYGFREILQDEHCIPAFREKVPIFDYDTMYEQWWHMALREVEDVSWPGKVTHFALSSGTSGAPSKHIPVTDDMRRSMKHAGLRMFFALTNFDVDPDLFTKAMLMLGGSSDLDNQGGYFRGDLSGINASQPPFWLRPYYKPGGKIARIKSWEEKIAEISRHAPEWDIGFLVGIPSWLQLMMERIIEDHQLNTIHDIWPNLEVCVHGGIAFEPLKKGFERLLDRPLIYMDSYLASEGFIAYQQRPETNAMRLLLHNGIFFEFIPFNSTNFDEDGQLIGSPNTLTIAEVQPGVDYALLLTTCAGAWRYLIGDTVRFPEAGNPEIIISGRTKHFLSICGEHLSVDNMNQGIQAVEEAMDLSIREFTVAPVQEGNRFVHHWYIGTEREVSPAEVARLLDEALKRVNDDYQTERNSLLGIKVEILPIQLFYDWQAAKGKLGGQNKFPRVMKGKRFAEWSAFVHRRLQQRRGA
ncbi:GH3 family domain-containing protein [Phaeodactylibacter luteus]|uniref:GH3 auxin-responsive promoter family protein n=1 Tax=Phaeodactylibacter luteus TaxID=1564516 RepID=A0A5C6RJ34_9BACT|nr:GH3 auxin-responsive promoter family protein [Phaeodactylibacter luteus]TXB62133.1 GH3 auxin-responsive promoter family protein [Phaeodactylibacter luteus]